jgi:hypothetical protein
LRLIAALSDGSGAVNEDACGYVGTPDNISAAWVFDGVTGINNRNYLPGGNDAAWIVGEAQGYLMRHAAGPVPLPDLLAGLVDHLIVAWNGASAGLSLPDDYDPPAACLVLAKKFTDGLKVLRLGDSSVLAKGACGLKVVTSVADAAEEHWLVTEAKKRRAAGTLDIKTLLAEFRPRLAASRQMRNMPGGYSILEATPKPNQFAEYYDMDGPLLLCTDGFYRARDIYKFHDDESLMHTCLEDGGAARVLAEIRRIEADDPHCHKHLRFKPADDATALVLA